MIKFDKRLNILIVLLIILMGIGFATISTTLSIIGNTSIVGDKNNFINNVYFKSANLTSNAISEIDLIDSQPKINGNKMTFTVPNTSSFKEVGDSLKVNYIIRNESNYNAIISIPTVTCNDNEFDDYIKVTHSRNTDITLMPDTDSEEQVLTLTMIKTYAKEDVKDFTFTVEINATATSSNTNGSNNEIAKKTINIISGDGTSIGDEIEIANEYFYVIGTDSNKIKLLSKYNLEVGYNCTFDFSYHCTEIENPSGIQNINSKGYLVENGNVITKTSVVPFSETNYWYDTKLKSKYGTKFPAYVYDENNIMKEYIDNYKNYLEAKGINVLDARLISHEELINLGCDLSNRTCKNAPNWVYLNSYWTGSAADYDAIININFAGFIGPNIFYNDIDGAGAVRPVIEVSKSLIIN